MFVMSPLILSKNISTHIYNDYSSIFIVEDELSAFSYPTCLSNLLNPNISSILFSLNVVLKELRLLTKGYGIATATPRACPWVLVSQLPSATSLTLSPDAPKFLYFIFLSVN